MYDNNLRRIRRRLWMSVDIKLFPDTKPAEDLTEQFVWRGLSHDLTKCCLRQAELLGEQIELSRGLL